MPRGSEDGKAERPPSVITGRFTGQVPVLPGDERAYCRMASVAGASRRAGIRTRRGRFPRMTHDHRPAPRAFTRRGTRGTRWAKAPVSREREHYPDRDAGGQLAVAGGDLLALTLATQVTTAGLAELRLFGGAPPCRAGSARLTAALQHEEFKVRCRVNSTAVLCPKCPVSTVPASLKDPWNVAPTNCMQQGRTLAA